jgi:hypothetical protein
MLGSFCIPYDDSYVNKDTFIAFKKAFFESSYGAATAQYFYDIAKSWQVILISAFVACIFGYCYLLIIRFIGGVIIWATLAVSIIILASSGFYTYFHARP